jgi:predicted acetyltransferase
MGWEVAGALAEVDLDAAAVPRTVPPGVSVRPAEPVERGVVHDVYERVARERAGLLTRTGGMFDVDPEAPWPSGVDGVTLVEQDGEVTGALVYGRGTGYGPEARLTAHDLLATTPEAGRALAGVLGGWSTVAHTLRVPLLDGDAFASVLPLERGRPTRLDTWMHRAVDVRRAVADRGWPAHVRGRVAFRLRDDAAPWNAGDWELAVADGAGELRRTTTEPDLWLDVRGFAVLFCAASTGRAAAQAGLAGGTADPAALDVLASGPRAALLDYF